MPVDRQRAMRAADDSPPPLLQQEPIFPLHRKKAGGRRALARARARDDVSILKFVFEFSEEKKKKGTALESRVVGISVTNTYLTGNPH
ncbi:hypothetical protein ACLOJK_035390 [Asimina triloba]